MTSEKKKGLNFKTLWIRFDATSSEKHQLFIKEHFVRKQEPEYPKGKTLFVVNIPPYATNESIKYAFSQCCGPVKRVTFSHNSLHLNIGFKKAYIVFQKEQGLSNALELSSDYTITLDSEKLPVITGIHKWCNEYNQSFIDEENLKNLINTCLTDYDKRKEKELRKEKHSEKKDSEGWMVATGRKKRGKSATIRKQSIIDSIVSKAEETRQKKQLLNFYPIQDREAKKEHIMELRKKFELDKKRLEQIKSQRKFRPF